MGKRRIRCLQAFDVAAQQIQVFDWRSDRRQECETLYGVTAVSSFEQGMAWEPDVVIVSLPTKLHMKYCLAVARAGKDFWCEIGLSDRLDETADLLALVKQNKLVVGIGLNNPFHYGLQQAKQWLRDFGPVLSYSITIGNYLPNWHPWEDYRDFYDETQIMGVVAQELGTLYALLDTRLSELYGQLYQLTALEIPGPDLVQLLGKTVDGTAVSLHIDLMQDRHPYEYRLISEKGVIEVSFMPDVYARYYSNATKEMAEVPPPAGYTFEQCYHDEFEAFLDVLESRSSWYHPLADAVQIVGCLQGLEESSRTGCKVAV